MFSYRLFRVFLGLGIFANLNLMGSRTFAEEQLPDTKEILKMIEDDKSVDDKGFIYFNVGGDVLVFVPNKIDVGLGASTQGGYVEGEVFLATNLFDTIDQNLPINTAVGARARFFPSGSKGRFFGELEYTHYLVDPEDKHTRVSESFSVGGGMRVAKNGRLSIGYINLKGGPEAQVNRDLDTLYLRYNHQFPKR